MINIKNLVSEFPLEHDFDDDGKCAACGGEDIDIDPESICKGELVRLIVAVIERMQT